MMKREMKKEEKCGEEPKAKEEYLGGKLKKVENKGGYNTPVIPFWRLEHHHQQQGKVANVVKDENSTIIQESPFYVPSASARKLGATIWKLDHYNLPLSSRMYHYHHSLVDEDNTRGAAGIHPTDPSPSSPDIPDSGGSLRRQVAASLIQHHQGIERRNRAIQPVSPASYGSSLEIAHYNAAVTPSSSVNIKRRVGNPGYSLKTSTELLKVLNRIWSLEEQHASNMSLIKELKRELDHARTQVKELTRNQQADRQEIGEVIKQITDGKLIRTSKAQDQISAAIRSVRDELEDERKLRKRSESLHRKLARDLSEVRTSLATSMEDLEDERRSRNLLEDLCDEFAWGLRDYDQELHNLKHKIDKDWAERTDQDRLILHISESWLDERMQMKQNTLNGLGEQSIAEKLKLEMETFLQIKQKGKSKNIDNIEQKGPTFHRSSLECIPLNLPISAPKTEDGENDSTGSDSHCFELSKPSNTNSKPQENKVEDYIEELERPNILHEKVSCYKAKERSPSNAQIKFEEQRGQSISQSVGDIENMEKKKNKEDDRGEIRVNRKLVITKEIKDVKHLDAKNKSEEGTGLSSNFVIDGLLRSHDCRNRQPENDFGFNAGENSDFRNHLSPVQKWTDKLPPHDINAGSSSRMPLEFKENSLKAKLIEARSRGQRSRSRLKGKKIPM